VQGTDRLLLTWRICDDLVTGSHSCTQVMRAERRYFRHIWLSVSHCSAVNIVPNHPFNIVVLA